MDINEKSLEIINKYRQATMGFAALWIWFFHLWDVVSKDGVCFYIESFIKRIGFCGVDIFFFLSAIGLTYSVSKCDICEFYSRRIKRIFPVYLIVVVIVAICKSWSVFTVIQIVSGCSFYMYSIYQFLWFVPAIMTCYFVFPWYYKLARKTGNLKIFIFISLAIWTFISVYCRSSVRQDMFGFTNRIPIFLIGILVGEILKHNTIELSKMMWILIVLIFLLGLYFAFLTNYMDFYLLVPLSNCCIPTLLMGTSLALIVPKTIDLLINSRFNIIGKCLYLFFGFFGSISFEFYCVQEEIGAFINSKYQISNLMMRNILIFVICVITAFLLRFCVNFVFKLLDIMKIKQGV